MCVVSMVSDHYFQKFPKPVMWDWPTWTEYLELKHKAELYDKMTGQPNCEKGDLPIREKEVQNFFKNRTLS